MNTPTAVAVATAGPPLPNLLTRILPASPAVQARGNLNLGIMANISIAVAAGCFWTKHAFPGHVFGALRLIFLVAILSKNADVGQCPFGMAQLRETVSGQGCDCAANNTGSVLRLCIRQ
jgi:hypothetical protein